MKKLLVIACIMLVCALPAFAASNWKANFLPKSPNVGKHTVGDVTAAGNIIIYTDDLLYSPPVAIQALNALGLAYTWYHADPAGFRSALQVQRWDIILVSHCTYYQLSLAWGDILMQMQKFGATVGIDTFDGDCSHDLGGFGPVLFETIGASEIFDFGPDDIFFANDLEFWGPLSGQFIRNIGVGYIDNGDIIGYIMPWAVVTAQWGGIWAPNNIRRFEPPCSWLDTWILDYNFSRQDAFNTWLVRLIWLDISPTAAQNESWGKIKAMYK
ncbi:MAG: hypothetical protein QME66_01405 [Candidatus Eisenbacteria bacterium]|nr:hypothetical protein [Candidatus Eisenbacteria bacterium]